MAVTEESKLASKVVEQSSDIKFTEEELKSLNDLNQGYQTKQQQFGQLKVQKLFHSNHIFQEIKYCLSENHHMLQFLKKSRFF